MQLGCIELEGGGPGCGWQASGLALGVRGLHDTLSAAEALAEVQAQGGTSIGQSPDMTSLRRTHGLLLGKQPGGSRRGSW